MILFLVPFWIGKLLPIPFQPIGLCLLLGAIGLIWKRRAVTAAGLVLLFLLSLHIVTDPLIRHLEEQYPALEVAACPTADAVIVLGGILPDDLRTSATEWGGAVDRFERGLELVRSGKAPYLVFTAAHHPASYDEATEGSRLRLEAIKRGLPADQILLTTQVHDTAGEAVAIRRTMQERGWKKVIVITSAFHMPRSMLLMRKQGIDAIPFPTDYLTGRHRRYTPFSFVPSLEALGDAEIVSREYLGMLFYRIAG